MAVLAIRLGIRRRRIENPAKRTANTTVIIMPQPTRSGPMRSVTQAIW
jgi:hypothetical protein